MQWKLAPVLAAVLAALAPPAMPCSAFVVLGDGRVLFGNNEDYLTPDTRVWFVPARDGRHGAMYLGFANGFPQGGMNDAGLAFDGSATGRKPLVEQDGKRRFAGNPIVEAMETCATVEEVVALLGEIDLRPLLERSMLFFADATGDAVIVEGDVFLRKEGDFQAVTNFYPSAHADDRAQCPRYAAVVDVLAARAETSVDLCTRALAAGAQRGRRVATLYSNVFDLPARTARLYLFHDYTQVVELDLAAELEKGAHELRLPELFPTNAAFERYADYAAMTAAQRIASRKGPELSRAALEAFAGAYDLAVGAETHRITLRRKGDGLEATSTIYRDVGGEMRFHSASPTEFFALAGDTEPSLRFHLDAQGRTTGFTLEQGGLEYEAERVESE
jgi:hypothetical protein